MFDLGVYVAPAVVLATMLLALLGFAVWGNRAIKESAEEAMAAAAHKPTKSDLLAPVVENAEKQSGIDLLTDDPAMNLERTAEFNQPAFAQSFMDGHEDSGADVDFNAAIERITADLEAAEAAKEEAGEAADDTEALDVDVEATQVIQPDDRAAILQDEAAADDEAAESIGENTDENTDENIDENISENIDGEIDENIEENIVDSTVAAIEQTLVMPKLDEAAAVADETVMFDQIALEETRTIEQIAAEPEPAGPAFGEGAEDVAAEGREESLFPESPIAFGPKMAWLAIPGYKPSEVISALRLSDVAPANWTKGLTEAYADNRQVFVTPALSGWVLVIGKTLWQKADMNRSAENIQWLKEVGRIFGNACFFSTMRGLGNHGWVGIRGGNIVRAYGYSGELQELIWLLGEPTEEEIAINAGFANETEEIREANFRPVIPDEKMVLAMAAAWSVDVSFGNRQYPPDYGFLGTLD